MKCYNCNATEATPLPMCPSSAQCGQPYRPNGKWKRAEPCVVYLDKVFSEHRVPGSSLFYALNTANDPDNFLCTLDLTPCNDNGCCRSNALAPDAVFEISRTFLQMDCFSVNDPAAPRAESGVITPEMVTINGSAVNAVTVADGTYTADVSDIAAALTDPVCAAQGLPSQAFLLLQNIPDLEFRVRIGVEGVVRSAGTIYQFRLYIANNETILLDPTLTASFSVAEMNLPCAENGRTPVIRFRFDADAEIIRPALSVTTDETSGESTVQFACTLGITPNVNVEVIRNSRVMLQAATQENNDPGGLDGFNLYAGRTCCAQSGTTAANGCGLIR